MIDDVATTLDKSIIKTFPAGTLMAYLGSEAPPGWLLLKEGSIGNKKSNATLFANENAQNIYALFWENFREVRLFPIVRRPVIRIIGGRGKTWHEDWVKDKPLCFTVKFMKLVRERYGAGYPVIVKI